MINRKLINQGLCILLGGMMAIGGACLPVLAGECDAGSTVIAAGEAQTEAAEENAAGEPEGIDAGEDTAEAEERQEEEAEITEMDISAEDKASSTLKKSRSFSFSSSILRKPII